MGVKLERKTAANQLLRLVSVTDDAIDWARTYGDEETSIPRKKSRYEKERKITDLVFKEGEKPTLFIFDHPWRVDVARKVRGLYQRSLAGRDNQDVFTEVWDKTFLGTQEGVDDAPMEAPPKRDGHITDAYFQAVEDAGVFEELAGCFLEVAGRYARAAEEREVAKKK